MKGSSDDYAILAVFGGFPRPFHFKMPFAQMSDLKYSTGPSLHRHVLKVALGVIALALCLALSPTVLAAGANATHVALYSASTPVTSQSAKARQKAFTRDLAEVLVKVSGNPNAAQVSALSDLLANAGNLVAEYRYRTVPLDQGGGQVLWARFDAKAVDRALIRNGQAIWGAGRPIVVVWLIDQGTMVADNPNDPVVAAMRKRARQRGLPLVVPLMDLTDQKAVSSFDIRTLFLPALRSASRRYGARAMLVGVINSASVGVRSNWTLVFDHNSTAFQKAGESPQKVAAAAVGQATTLLAQTLAYTPGVGGGAEVHVVVSGVGSLADLKKVQALITAVPGVSSVRVDAVRGNQVRFGVPYAGAPADLDQALTVSSSLNAAPVSATVLTPAAASGSAGESAELHLVYTP